MVLVGWSMGALVSWEYVARFGTDRIRALVDVDMEPSPLRRPDYDHGTYTVEGLRDPLVEIRTEPVDPIERNIEALLKDPPSRELWITMFDEHSRTPPPIQAAILLEILRDYPDVLSAVDVPMLVCAGADEKWRSVAAVRGVTDLVPETEFVLFEERGHCPTVEEPEPFERELREFVGSQG